MYEHIGSGDSCYEHYAKKVKKLKAGNADIDVDELIGDIYNAYADGLISSSESDTLLHALEDLGYEI